MTNTVTILSDPVARKSDKGEKELQVRWSETSSNDEGPDCCDVADVNSDKDVEGIVDSPRVHPDSHSGENCDAEDDKNPEIVVDRESHCQKPLI